MDSDDDVYDGSVLRIMFDEDAGPLWGDEGLLPQDEQWIRRVLGLTDALTNDLLDWHQDMSSFHYGRLSAADWGEQKRRLDDRGHALAERLDAEVGRRFRVWYHA